MVSRVVGPSLHARTRKIQAQIQRQLHTVRLYIGNNILKRKERVSIVSWVVGPSPHARKIQAAHCDHCRGGEITAEYLPWFNFKGG
jgi:hypothetical protein